MKWSYTEPTYGDMIRVAVCGFYHFGIYVSDDEVIQFGLPPSRRTNLDNSTIEVLASSIDDFLSGGFLEVCEFDKKEKKKNRSPKGIVEYARSKIGTRGYNILYNNCEHFANECVSGTHLCQQAEDVRAYFQKMPIVDLYIARLPEGKIGDVECKARQYEIQSVSNEKIKREKYFVWKLLRYALEHSFGAKGKKMELVKESHGGWSAGDAFVSLSHSNNALAVVVSRATVGVDIELVREPKIHSLAERIMTDDELNAYNATSPEQKNTRLFEIWTAKEAIFKSKKLAAFVPKDHDTLSSTYKSGNIIIDTQKYIWSVATSTPERLRIFTDIDLTKID